jgi:hypothetical protein
MDSAKTNCLAKNCMTLLALKRIPGLERISKAFLILFFISLLLPCAIILSAIFNARVAILTIEDLLVPICRDHPFFATLSKNNLSLVLLSGTLKNASTRVMSERPSSLVRLYSETNNDSRSG